ncbi:MAG: DNA-processing protein DprA [Patescibacteria group bacterium]
MHDDGKEFGGREVGTISRASLEYPPLLNEVPDAPDPLHFLGDYKESLFKNTLGVVGSRAVTMYGEWVVKNIVKEVARYGVTIVSGFMYGVDALAHKAALEVEGSTIAVMAGGVDQILPKYQEQLYLDIVERGLVVSEFYKNPEFGGWMFAKRNRIVAGLSYAVLVVEAAEESGSLITASYAKQYGRQLLSVPANLNSKNAVGTTQLLKDGAKMVTCANDILQLYFGTPNNPFGDSNNYRYDVSSAVNKRLSLDKNDDSNDEDSCHNDNPSHDESPRYDTNSPQNILDLLYLEPLSADEVSSKLHISSANVLKCLTGLSVIGQVCEKDGRYYAG